uniref:Uncharacterized protein n=1 Tax=Brassica oleracea TaxID=3712 RepID=A0A3P6DNU1_BRAOL|nr:unnamed protein product [Brassica oleracea]
MILTEEALRIDIRAPPDILPTILFFHDVIESWRLWLFILGAGPDRRWYWLHSKRSKKKK